MGMKHTISLRKAFWKFLVMLILGLVGAVVLPFSIMIFAIELGYATYANYSERSAENIAPILAVTPDLSEVELPAGIKFLRMDKEYKILETTLDEEELSNAMKYAVSGKTDRNLKKQYLLITREKEYVVLQYYIGSQFTNSWMNEHFPSPEKILYIVMAINCLAVCMLLTGRFSRELRKQLNPLFEATAEITAKNLEFEVGHSTVKEFEEVLLSFTKMKDNLKYSLEQQWKMEQMQKEQIAALAHDLKTPLTVILGNIDLMSETNLDEEQKGYAGYITDSAGQMQFYIKKLIELSRACTEYPMQKEQVHFASYMEKIKEQVVALCDTKKIRLDWKTSTDCQKMELDTMLLERAVLNVLSNALEYSPVNGTIFITVHHAEGELKICVRDEGKGFSKEALRHAKEQFFMENAGRTSKMHFGMGLFIVESMMKQCHGTLQIENDETTHGGKVTLTLPC